jgi:glycosyltransferase involved in cell wall biosynthesis
VVIPHLNEPDDLRRCLTSLQAQKVDGIPFEVIVVDNGSRSLPHDVCSEFKDTRLERESTPGPGPARSRGASLARAEIVSFIDADCLADKGWIRGIFDFLNRNPDIHVVAGDVQVSRQDPNVPTSFELYESIFSYLIPIYVERDHYAATGNMSVRRETFRTVGPFGGIDIAEDREWGRRAAVLGFRLAYVPHVRVFTPACKSFTELSRRWDRAIAHDFEEIRFGPRGKVGWALRSLAVAASPPFELAKILRSGKIANLSECWPVFTCLVHIRLYRAGKMMALAFRGNGRDLVGQWNRE